MPLALRRWLPIALIALVALWLRTRDLAARPMHSDEANQAVKFGQLLETGHYAFDPRDHHGPTLYYAALPIAWLRGQHTLASLDETTVRLVPALFGTAAIVLIFLLALPLGGATPSSRIQAPSDSSVGLRPASRPSETAAAGSVAPPIAPETQAQNPKLKTQNQTYLALAAAAFLAVSPPAVYYGRYFIQETLLVTFILATFACAQRWWRTGHLAWAIAAGLCIGLAESTKITAPLFLVAGVVALLAARPLPAPASPGILRAAVAATIGALITAALLYSSFGTHFAGVRDAFTAVVYGLHRAGGGETGHEKPWWYYLRLFGGHREGGLLFQQIAFTLLALAGAALAFVSLKSRRVPSNCHTLYDNGSGASGRDPAPSPASSERAWASPSSSLRWAFLRWATVYTLIIAAVLSLTPYKTPWHAIHLVPGLALLAAGALAALPKLWLSLPVAAVALAFQVRQTDLVTILRPADPRNPYAYVHSSPDVLKFRARADAALARNPGAVIRVISAEYWPLPWYFRGLSRVGYWTTPPADCDGALVITSAALAPAVRARLHGDYRETYLGLRPGFLCVVFTPRS
ncbi:MAG TPA: phospholipid carrier-dependent glycosyltransferase [Opitutus sp.]|nr:phospholipid carrier-dependent glycosyltransferase [Opitutus sp.]